MVRNASLVAALMRGGACCVPVVARRLCFGGNARQSEGKAPGSASVPRAMRKFGAGALRLTSVYLLRSSAKRLRCSVLRGSRETFRLRLHLFPRAETRWAGEKGRVPHRRFGHICGALSPPQVFVSWRARQAGLALAALGRKRQVNTPVSRNALRIVGRPSWPPERKEWVCAEFNIP